MCQYVNVCECVRMCEFRCVCIGVYLCVCIYMRSEVLQEASVLFIETMSLTGPELTR